MEEVHFHAQNGGFFTWLAHRCTIRCKEDWQGEFSLVEVYAFESELARLHPDNRHVKDKIRQQLQLLRDKGILDFAGKESIPFDPD